MCSNVLFCVCLVSRRGVIVSGVAWRKLWDVVLKQSETGKAAKKSSASRHSNISPLKSTFFPAGPLLGHTLPWPPTTTRTLVLCHFQRRPLGCSVDKPKEGELGVICFAGDMETLTWSWPIPPGCQGSRSLSFWVKTCNHNTEGNKKASLTLDSITNIAHCSLSAPTWRQFWSHTMRKYLLL